MQKFSHCSQSDSDSNPNCQVQEWDRNPKSIPESVSGNVNESLCVMMLWVYPTMSYNEHLAKTINLFSCYKIIMYCNKYLKRLDPVHIETKSGFTLRLNTCISYFGGLRSLWMSGFGFIPCRYSTPRAHCKHQLMAWQRCTRCTWFLHATLIKDRKINTFIGTLYN